MSLVNDDVTMKSKSEASRITFEIKLIKYEEFQTWDCVFFNGLAKYLARDNFSSLEILKRGGFNLCRTFTDSSTINLGSVRINCTNNCVLKNFLGTLAKLDKIVDSFSERRYGDKFC